MSTRPKRFLLDTNIVIGLLKGPGAARELVDKSGGPPQDCAISQITRMELLSFPGIKADEEMRVRDALDKMTVLLLDADVERAAISLRLRARLKLPDAIIAATAEVHGLKLLTLDARLSGSLTRRT